MNKFTLFIGCILSISGSCNEQSKNKLVFDFIVKDIQKGSNDWYQIKEEFINQDCVGSKKYSSAYLCIRQMTGDTVWIISPCLNLHYKENIKAQLFYDVNVSTGDTLIMKISKDKIQSFNNHPKLYGSLKIPTD